MNEETFDLAFSFAGEDREYVRLVKEACEKLGLSVYYDKDRKIDQWGKSFIGEQRKVYGGYKTKHFVPFISEHYFAKPIPTDEFRSALMQSVKRSQYILPVKLDNSTVSTEYLHPDTQYLKRQEYSPEQLAGALRCIVDQGAEPAKDVDQLLDDELKLPTPKIIPRAYSKLREATALLEYLERNFIIGLRKLEAEGYVGTVRAHDDSVRVAVERDGKTFFVLNIFFANGMGDNVLGFNLNERLHSAGSQSMHGMIEPHFNVDQQTAGYKVMDLSNLGPLGEFHSKEGVMRLLWEKLIKELELRA